MIPLQNTIKLIQSKLGVTEDGIFGPVTALAVLAALLDSSVKLKIETPVSSTDYVFDARSEELLALLDPKAQPFFRRFLARAKAIAATLGCDYQMISSLRTWEEQDALYNKHPRVTQAMGGYSWHNFGVAADFGVFRDDEYLDGSDSKSSRALASQVHHACSNAANDCGLKWGGAWRGFTDEPHFQLAKLSDSPLDSDRKLYKQKGSVL